ncbi:MULTISPECIES: MAPEG family protein [Hydrocarboniphaga]|jgi:uncharacterized MAPEG superfamily protein|uniref:MAPEG family protein n=1 Tax=Hydrocarboniphaga effusa AP103 TaxID=1172194 RepID=I7Z9Q8_9GAMM|nr:MULTISPECIES: MAPEG family protein [Hydrocarboniphaga]EIT68559.1 hypothetical protein WQQ_37540 [Hydrocarboniphaga effusa AP103]MDZ4077091.1 MAPEG family protein [Hydrocarboniphaga sp.]
MVAVLLFAAWTLLLAMIYVVPRVPPVMLFKKPADSWTRGKPNTDPAILVRAQHAHLNAVENLPVFAAIVAMAMLMNRADAVDPLAAYVLYARVGQSLVHLTGTSFIQVLLRATFYFAQVLLMAWMIWQLVG